MLMFERPYCGVLADETELSPGGQAHLRREGPGTAADVFEGYMFLRENPKGPHLERWRHSMGCGKWFHTARSTTTLVVFGTYPAQMEGPPEEIRRRIVARHPEWSWGDDA